ncbi:MAG: hypothetical protein IMF06_13955 [Proteobacteria bacterium]|nr:hypothetical protein [Pseudomonadota bacterium]
MNDPLQKEAPDDAPGSKAQPRQRYVLDDTGFNEVPKKYRKFYRKFGGPGDTLAPNEVLCPVCMVVVRSSRELRPGDRVYCMPCFSRLIVIECNGRLEARPVY